MSTLSQDVSYGLRMLRRAPGFTAVVVLVLALGIAVNTVVFSVVNAVMLRPLPYKNADRIVIPWQKNKEGLDFGVSGEGVTFLRRQCRSFEYVAGHHGRRVYVTGINRPREEVATAVSPCLFDLLGIRPLLGRGFQPDQDLRGNEHVIVLSHASWKDYFGGEPDTIGKTINLVSQDMTSNGELVTNSVSYTVIGIMPAQFKFPFARSAPFWVPLVPDRTPARLLARLKKDATLERARAEMATMVEGLRQLDPTLGVEATAGVDRLMDRLLKGNDRVLMLLWGAAGFVLLITCSTAANLFLARAMARRREMATREALGASRWRLVHQMLTESFMMSFGAGLFGLAATFCTIGGLVGLCPADVPRLDETRVDATVLLFTLGISVLTGLIFGLMPAWRASGISVGQTLKEGLSCARSHHHWRHVRGGLVIAQIGVSLMLLIGASLLIRSLIALQEVDLGFRPQNALAMHIDLPRMKYPGKHECQAFFDPLLERVGALAEVRGAALACPGLDWGGGGAFIDIRVEGYVPEPGQSPYAKWMAVTPGFFQAMGIKVLQGRTFTDRDLQIGRGSGVIIDENMARKYFAGADPLGRKMNGAPIIGVVSTVRDFDVLRPAHDTFYMPLSTNLHFQSMDLVVRTAGDPMSLAPILRTQVALVDKDQTNISIDTLAGTLAGMLAPRRFIMVLLSLFASLALILATAGLYGLLQYNTMQQTHDIGIRMALGARGTDVLKVVLGRGLLLALVGIAVGLIGALALSRVLSSLLYDVTPTDPVTLIGISVALAAVAALASFLPARRAARIDPMEALRYE